MRSEGSELILLKHNAHVAPLNICDRIPVFRRKFQNYSTAFPLLIYIYYINVFKENIRFVFCF